MNWKLLTYFFVASFYGCIDSIEIPLPQHQNGRLVIDGSVDRASDKYSATVFVSRTFPTEGFVNRNLIGAEIYLRYMGQDIIQLQNGETLETPISLFHEMHGGDIESASFSISVLVDGQQYVSEEQMILASPPKGFLSTKVIEREELNDREFILNRSYVELLITTELRNEAQELVSLLWEVDAYYEFPEIIWDENNLFFDPKTCYVFDPGNSNQIHFINSLSISQDKLVDFEIDERRADYKFHAAHLYIVVQRTLDPGAAQYWEQVSLGIEREGSIFDEPPGRSLSNIKHTSDPDREVLGYFYASEVDTIHKLALSAETGNQRHFCSAIMPESPCCSCLDIAGSSLTKPKYWTR